MNPLESPSREPSADRTPLYIVAALSAFLILLHRAGVFMSLDNRWADEMFRWRGMEAGDPRVVLVTIDDESVKRMGQFPWPRHVYGQLLDKLFSYGVKVAGLDVFFVDASSPEEDAALVLAAAKWADRTVHAVPTDSAVKNMNVFMFPIPALRAVVKYMGCVTQTQLDPDGSTRRANLIVGSRHGDPALWPQDPERLPTLALQSLALYEGRPVEEYLRGRSNTVLLNIRGQTQRQIGNVRDRSGNSVPAFADVYAIRRIGAWKVLTGDLAPSERESLKGSLALVGSTTLGAYDHFPSPFTEQSPGVEVHANVVDNLLNHRELHQVPGACTYALILLFAFFSLWAITLSPLRAPLATLGMFLGWGAANYVLFRRLVLLEFSAPAAALLGSFGMLFIRKMRRESQEKRFIKQTFGQYVAPEVVDILVKDPSRIRLGGDKREMTVFFLDIAHFTTISEKMTPEALIQFLNYYLTALTDIIHRNKGVVDKYIGDCIMAFWNAPLDEPKHRELACLAAVECIEAVRKLNEEYVDPTMPEKPAIRIGLNSGHMVVGNTGSARKLAYTVLGDEVNLASRLEGANKFFGSRILVSEECYRGAREAVEARELGRVRVVGKATPIRVFELLARKGQLQNGWSKALPFYRQGLEQFHNGVALGLKKESEKAAAAFGQAKATFEEVLKIVPGDAPSKFYLNVSADYSQIPPPDWDGVFNLTAK